MLFDCADDLFMKTTELPLDANFALERVHFALIVEFIELEFEQCVIFRDQKLHLGANWTLYFHESYAVAAHQFRFPCLRRCCFGVVLFVGGTSVFVS